MAKALKTCVGDASRVVAESEKSSARAAHLRSRASQAQKVYDATLAAEELSAQWVEMEIMLGKDKAPRAGEKVKGALGARMYASMVKRGNKISELA